MPNSPFVAPLLALSRHPLLATVADHAVKAAALLSLLFLLAGYMLLPTVPVFGHDEMHYYPYFDFKLREDGRWLNYLLHDFLRSVPLPLWSVLFVSLSWLLFYRIARIHAFEVAYAALVASTIVLTTPFLEISLWPGTVVPVLLLGLLATELRARGVSHRVVYMLSGLLMFGSMQTLYFVLPLLFLPQLFASSTSAGERWKLLASHMCWWVGGSIAGVLCMSLALRLLGGTFLVQPAEWRNINPAVDLETFQQNLSYVTERFFLILGQLRRAGGVGWSFVLAIAVVVLLRLRTLLTQLPAWLLLLAVLVSFFAFSVPLAAVILSRSLIAMTAALVFAVAILPGRTAPGRLLGTALLLTLAYNFSALCQDYLKTHDAETATLLGKLEALFPGYPKAYGTVALYGTMDAEQPEADRFNDPYRMHPFLITLGVHTYLDCRIVPSRCEQVGAGGAPLAEVPFGNGRLEFAVDSENTGIISFRE